MNGTPILIQVSADSRSVTVHDNSGTHFFLAQDAYALSVALNAALPQLVQPFAPVTVRVINEKSR